MHQNYVPAMRLRRLKRVDTRAYRGVRLEASLDPAFAMSSASFESVNDSGIYRAFLMSPQGWVIGAFHQHQMLGIVHLDPAAIQQEYVLWGLYVTQNDRQTGVGGALALRVINIAQSLSATAVRLHVSGSNHAAKRLYQRLGFVNQMDRVNALQTDTDLTLKPTAAAMAHENLDGSELMVCHLQAGMIGNDELPDQRRC